MNRPSGAKRRWMVPVAFVLAALAAVTLVAWTTAFAAPRGGASVPQPVAGRLVTFKSPTCACCAGWEQYMRDAGWAVDSRPTSDLAARKRELGVPASAASCHTSVIEGYVVEGHVPLAAIERLLMDRPDIVGIALPGMPAGSPGMDGQSTGPFLVLAIENDGSLSPFGRFPA